MRAVIVEDEAVAAQALQTLLSRNFPDIRVETVLQSIDESVEWFRENGTCDLVFMDIHLADGSAFAIFDEVEIASPVIFTTAYDEYALKAFEVNSVDYLLKPIDENALRRAVTKLKNLSGRPVTHVRELIEFIRKEKRYKSLFLIPDRDKLIPLSVNDIAYVWIDLKMVKAVDFRGASYLLDMPLDEITEQLDPVWFFRANRQFIISRRAVEDISVWFGNKLSVNLKVPVPEKILVSKARVKEFKDWITGC